MTRLSTRLCVLIFCLLAAPCEMSAQGMSQGVAPPPTAKTTKCKGRLIPQLEDVMERAGIRFSHISAPEARYIIESMSGGVLLLDYDRDGWLDLFTVTGHVYPQAEQFTSAAKYREPKLLQFNQGDGTFCDASDQAGPAIQEPRVSRGLAVGDLFNDGNMDLVVEDLVGSPMILRNHGLPGKHWVSFELAGTRSNRLAIGARLKIVAGGMTQTSEIHSGGSYLSQHDLRVHFGLDKATKVDSLEIRWPSGELETLKDLEADKFYSVLEGEGIVPAAKIRPSGAAKTN